MRTKILMASLALGCVACTGRTVDCLSTPSDPICQVADSGPPVDMGTDTGPVDAHVACNGTCSGATPHCLVSGTSETCVGCLAEGDCSGSTPHCDTMGSHTCVACVDSMQCTAADAAFCDPSHTCQPCTISTQCAHLTATPVCVTTGAMMGTCAQCNTNADCTGPNMGCDTSTHMCVSYTPGSGVVCSECVADAECPTGQLCVPMTFHSMPVGNFCVWRRDATGSGAPNGSCNNVPPHVNLVSTTSVDGVAAMFCELQVSTCPAFNNFRRGATVPPPPVTMCTGMTTGTMDDPGCGAPGLADGFCRVDTSMNHYCTIGCSTMQDCPCTDITCTAQYPCTAGLCALNP